MKYGFIQDQSDKFTVKKMCQVLKASRSGYNDWLNRKPSKRARNNKELKRHIAKIYWKFRGAFGSPRIHKQLVNEGISVNAKRVARLMRVFRLKRYSKALIQGYN